MLEFVIGLVTSWPALILAGGVGVVARVLMLFGLVPIEWRALARIGGFILCCLALFLLGYRTADDHAAEQAQLAKLRGEVASLNHQLAVQTLVAATAQAERTALDTEKSAAEGRAADYKAKLANLEKKAPGHACDLDDADLRFRDGLRQRTR